MMRYLLAVFLLFVGGKPGADFFLSAQQPLSRTAAPINAVATQGASDYPVVKTLTFGDWDLVTALAWSPDNTTLVAAVSDRLYSYDCQTWETTWEYKVGAFTQSLAFSPDGDMLAAGSRDGVVRIWRGLLISGPGGNFPPALEIEAHKKGVNSVAFDPLNRYLASGGNDAVARFWDSQSGEKMGEIIGGSFAVPAIAFSPDGTVLAVANGDVVRLREVGSERIIGTIQAKAPIYSLAYHPNGGWLATGSTENGLDTWDPAQAFRTGMAGYPDPVTFAGHEGKSGTYQTLVWQVLFHPDGGILASAGGDGTLRLWDTQDQRMLAIFKENTRAVTSLAFSPDGVYLAAGSLDGRLNIWKLEN